MGVIDILYKNLSGKDPEHVHPIIKAKRIAHCKGNKYKKKCDELVFGTNCKLCGCFVDFKTDYKAESCPIKRW
jgi:hypothetical protein